MNINCYEPRETQATTDSIDRCIVFRFILFVTSLVSYYDYSCTSNHAPGQYTSHILYVIQLTLELCI